MMARKGKKRPAPKVTLPPFTWDTEATLSDGGTYNLARPAVRQDNIETLGVEDDRIVSHRARVWRVKQPPVLRILNPAAKAAVLDYVDVFETVHSSGGTSDPTGGGGGGAGARGPSLRAITAAERLRTMHTALEGGEMIVPIKDAQRQRRGPRTARIALRQLVQWAAIDEMNGAEILKKAGAAPSNEIAQDAVTVAVAEIGTRLAVCCGYMPAAELTC
ncbi:hypothetical protein GFB49_11580 [Epibacterium sp. SM1979]|uniref:Uncharacterized protein n=1 Tax=Tritonibacter litoralis TaxID=2662264 RepID=A0A843YK75_9RHOB|nr:hypothetical protein [Tritonibacter litoralis]MQQ09097.1 hypothetical protein [Tritonibacter litoralis]